MPLSTAAPASLTLSGVDTVAIYQQVLRTVTYDNSSQDPNLTDRSITFVANDGTDNSNVGTTTVMMSEVDDAPTNTVPVAQSTDEDTILTFSSGGGNAISISDVDAGGGDMAVTLNATNGTLTLSGIAGLAFTTGDGTDDASMVFTGTIAAINTALEGMTFDPTPEYNGAASVQIITDDQGNTGSGGPLTDDDTVAITVNAIDDAPINNVPVTQSVDEDTILTFSAGGSNAISISDVDAGSGDMAVTLNATNGTLTLSGIGRLAFTTGDGTADASMVFTGTITAINTALEGMTFDPTPDYSGAASVQIITDDQGNTGSGGPLTDDDTVAITVAMTVNEPDLSNRSRSRSQFG